MAMMGGSRRKGTVHALHNIGFYLYAYTEGSTNHTILFFPRANKKSGGHAPAGVERQAGTSADRIFDHRRNDPT